MNYLDETSPLWIPCKQHDPTEDQWKTARMVAGGDSVTIVKYHTVTYQVIAEIQRTTITSRWLIDPNGDADLIHDESEA